MKLFGVEIGISYFDLPLIFLGLLGIYIFIKLWEFVKREMKAQLTGDKKRPGKYLSRFVSSSIMTLGFIFIIALIVSTLAINTIFGIQELRLIFIDAMVKPWQFETLIPIILIILFGFIALYPLLELLMLANKNAKTPTNIHAYLKRKFLRHKALLSHFIAILLFIVIILGPPTLISYICIRLDLRSFFNYAFTELTLIILIFLAYLILIPIMYLVYYSNFSKAGFVARARKVSSYKIGFFRKIGTYILVIVALISFISSVYSLITNVPILWGDYPQITTSYKDIKQGGLIEDILRQIMNVANASTDIIDRFNFYIAIIPVDFLLFLISTVLFGFLGFFSQFWRKQSLNLAQTIWFAAYIVCGLSLNILLNILMQFPWVLPDFMIFEMSDTFHQFIITRFFGISFVVSKIFIVCFFIYHAFFNKKLSGIVVEELISISGKRDEKKQDKSGKKDEERFENTEEVDNKMDLGES
ncbi:MAG: hypothetical protein ACTSWY_11340 [Promethearchaeota archaeon]